METLSGVKKMSTNQRLDILTINRSGFREQCRPCFNRELIYGLEYVAADYLQKPINQDVPVNSVDWYGLSDLTVE